MANDVDGFSDVRVNSNGTKVSFLAMVGGSVDSNVWVWDVEADQVSTFDLGIAGRTPVASFWDSSEPKVSLSLRRQ